MNLPSLADQFKSAVETAEKRWTMLRTDKFNQRLLTRYVRDLRRCRRLRLELSHLMETGKL